MDPTQLHALISSAFKARDNAHAPYSKFRVGAALLSSSGAHIAGCNVENASYGAGICAERTAIVKGVSEGEKQYTAVVVVSDVPTPTISPCGICRQSLREFCPLSTPVYMVASTYPALAPADGPAPAFLAPGEPWPRTTDEKVVVVLTLEQLLPMSFGPDNLT
ncbi:Cytidine deaminase [Vanrija pseudolonga]|uniref:Cytidine deaminase n=1 Tax=Vanrija pseudolonga TaxID=143232 RepID=A0AAF0Y1S9_9TREE|nr:Cytidine deaminase [Vanrija pseudolonga]